MLKDRSGEMSEENTITLHSVSTERNSALLISAFQVHSTSFLPTLLQETVPCVGN